MKHLISATSCLTLSLSLALLSPSAAEACGGTFCDTGPMAMPVDQTGENILFKISPTSVEAHIQIQIDPNTSAEKFAWVIPVTAVPEFEVGSQILFDNMLAGSVPTYSNNRTSDSCGDNAGGFGTDGGESGGGEEDTGGPLEGGDPEIVLQESVGAFEVAVLQGGTVEGVMTWLGDNGYEQDPNSEPILAQYLQDEFLFVALKLGVEVDVSEVHPIVIRYAGDEPCVPLRLTAIAAADDMDIRTFFLDEARVVPINYRHVLVNPLKIDWFNLADNYKEVISMAVDAQEADGNAFVTEYAGDSSVISLVGIWNVAWDSAPFAALLDTPVGALDELANQSLYSCDGVDCVASHPLIEPMLAEFIPVPTGLDAVQFYSCLECFAADIDLTAWDPAMFAQRLDERVIQPGLAARQLVVDNPYLTRMYTTISPSEMNADPIFRANASLPQVANARRSTQNRACDDSTTVTLPDGRQIYFPPGAPLVWPDFDDQMPWEEDVDEEGMANDAPLISLVDNTDLINQLLADHNANNGMGAGADAGDAAGCGCTTRDRGPGGLVLGLGLLGLLGLRLRRR